MILEHFIKENAMPGGKIRVTFTARGEDYIDNLRSRLTRGGISQGALAREMSRIASDGSGGATGRKYDKPQISRWLHRRCVPSMASLELIERAVRVMRETL